MATLPQFQTNIVELAQMQNTWGTQLNPLLRNPANQSILLKDVQLSTGVNNIDTRLGRKLQGWSIVRQRSAANIYDDQDNNLFPQLTLTLISSANVSVDLLVF